ncbi:AraC family transcriptional regulator [Pseudonocardia ailaonensis]|uniref:AraC family transcriptional regulator n=1 Tax=Pseudonocardia ailaonensis TaxID=367279 RepID=A0ABN2MMZ6_9PSEU
MYREIAPPPALRGLVECLWVARPTGPTRVLPDGCMDLLLDGGDLDRGDLNGGDLDGGDVDRGGLGGAGGAAAGGALGRGLTVAGPDTTAFLAGNTAGRLTAGLRFHPGALPRLLGVPASEVRDSRVPLAELSPVAARLTSVAARRTARRSLAEDPLGPGPRSSFDRAYSGEAFALVAALAAGEERPETAPWSRAEMRGVTRLLARGAEVREVAAELGRTERTLARQCAAIYGYGPSVLRRVLRFRRAAGLLHAGVAPAEVAVRVGYADQPHLTRETRALAGTTPAALRRA